MIFGGRRTGGERRSQARRLARNRRGRQEREMRRRRRRSRIWRKTKRRTQVKVGEGGEAPHRWASASSSTQHPVLRLLVSRHHFSLHYYEFVYQKRELLFILPEMGRIKENYQKRVNLIKTLKYP